MSILTDPYICAITPPLSYQALMRVDTAFTALSDGFFQSDCDWFHRHSKRKLLLRRESNGEFDGHIVTQRHPAFHVCLDRPRLWVLVTQLAPGTHLCIPVYRGAAFWSEDATEYAKPNVTVPAVASDEETASLLIEIQRRNGIDVEEFNGWLKRYTEAVGAEQSCKHQTKVIH